AALLGLALTRWLSASQIAQWGWRIPLLAGCLLVPFLFVLRRSLDETEVFQSRPRPPAPRELARSVLQNWRIILIGMMMATMTTVSFYLVTTYTPTFGNSVLHLAPEWSLIVTLCVG